MNKGAFTGTSIVYFVAISIIATILTAKLGFVLANPQLFLDQAVSSASDRVVMVCNGFSQEETFPPAPAGSAYVCGTSSDVAQKKGMEAILFARNMIALGLSLKDFKNWISELRKNPDPEAVKEFTEEILDMSDELDDFEEGRKILKEVKELDDEADEAIELEKRIKSGEATEKDVERYRKLNEDIEGRLDELYKYFSESAEFEGIAKYIERIKKIKDFDKLSEVEKAKLLEDLEKDLKSSISKLKAEKGAIEALEEAGMAKELSGMKRILKEERIEEVKVLGEGTLNGYRDVYEMVTTKHTIKVTKYFSVVAEEAFVSAEISSVNYLRRIFPAIKACAIAGASGIVSVTSYISKASKAARSTLGKLRKFLKRGEGFFIHGERLFFIPQVEENFEIPSDLYNDIPDYWRLLENFNGYAYVYLPNTLMLLNLAGDDVEKIANESFRLSQNLTSIAHDLRENLVEASSEAGFLSLKEVLISQDGETNIFAMDMSNNVIFNPYYMGILINSYGVSVCRACDCREHKDFVEKINNLTIDALLGAPIKPGDVPTISDCDFSNEKKEELDDILKGIEKYERKAQEVVDSFLSNVVNGTREIMKEKCETKTINFGDKSYTISKCGVIIDCSLRNDICFISAPVVEGDAIEIPVDTVSPSIAAPFFKVAGKYYATTAKVLGAPQGFIVGDMPPADGVIICVEKTDSGLRACRIIKCGKPIECKVETSVGVEARYNSSTGHVEIAGSIIPWH